MGAVLLERLEAAASAVVPVTVIEVWTLAILSAAVLVVAIALAIGPALVSARSRPADLLRTE